MLDRAAVLSFAIRDEDFQLSKFMSLIRLITPPVGTLAADISRYLPT